LIVTSPDFLNNYIGESMEEIRSQHTFVILYMYIQGSPVEIQTRNTLALDRPQYDRSTACVIAQQYSSTTFVSLRFRFRKEKFGARLRTIITEIFNHF